MSTFETNPTGPCISEKYLDILQAEKERVYPDPMTCTRITKEELVIAPGVYGSIMGRTNYLMPIKSMEKLERLMQYIKDFTPETSGYTINYKPRLPIIDTTFHLENVIHSFEVDWANPYFKLDPLICATFQYFYPEESNGIHYTFIQPREYYTRDLKLGVNSEYVMRELTYCGMYHDHPIYYDGNDRLFDLTLENSDGVHIRELLKDTMLNADFLNSAIMKGFIKVKAPRIKPFETPQQNNSRKSRRYKAPWMK